jgi:hypothetical protein
MLLSKTFRLFMPVLAAGLLLGLGLAALGAQAAAPQAMAAPPAGYSDLLPLPVLKDSAPGTSSGPGCWASGAVAVENGCYPFSSEPEALYGGLPSMVISTTYGDNNWDWWGGALAGVGWTSYSLENYIANGHLEFNVKGTVPGQSVAIHLRDIVPGRAGGNEQGGPEVQLSAYVTLSTEWQHVSIPLADLIAPSQNPRQMQQVRFDRSYSAPAQTFKLWINDIQFTSPDSEPSFAAIKVNQVGYELWNEKYALVSGFAENFTTTVGTTFTLHLSATNQAVYTGTLALISDYEAFVSGERILTADFSDFDTPGTYILRVDDASIPASDPFIIGHDIYDSLLVDAARYYFYQRQGITLTAEHAPDFPRGLGHPQDATGRWKSDLDGVPGAITRTVDFSKGWYDAGDYGKYTPFAASAVVDLLSAYEMFGIAFPDDHLNIPESGNGLPDILDEIKWEMDWVLTMQDPATGGFYQLVYPNNGPENCASQNPNTCVPERDNTVRYIADLVNGQPDVKPTEATAKAVAYLAAAARIFHAYDADYAHTLYHAAQRGWAYLQAHPENIAATGWNGAVLTDTQQRMWAAGEMFRATVELSGTAAAAVYDAYFLERYELFASNWLTTTENAGDEVFPGFLAYNASPAADPTEKAWFLEHFGLWREGQLARSEDGAWRNFLHDGSDAWDSDYYWGSNSVTLQTIVILARGSAIAGNLDSRILRAAHAQLNYILGVNPLAQSYVSGYGTRSPETIYSTIYSYDGVPGIPNGYLAEGPNEYSCPLCYSRFPGKAYRDNNSDWTTSEHAIYFNARLVYVAALVNAFAEAALELSPLADQTVLVNQPITVTGQITLTAAVTPTALAHTLGVDWMDGTTTTLDLAAGETTFAATHVYTATGVYTATVTASNALGLSDTQPFAVTVTAIAPPPHYHIFLPLIVRQP